MTAGVPLIAVSDRAVVSRGRASTIGIGGHSANAGTFSFGTPRQNVHVYMAPVALYYHARTEALG